MRIGFALVGLLFMLLFLLLLLFGYATEAQGSGSPATNAFLLEWLVFTTASFVLAVRPPKLKKRWVLAVTLMCYLVLAVGNLLLAFDSGECFDLYGNVYPYAGLDPYEWQACIPQLQ